MTERYIQKNCKLKYSNMYLWMSTLSQCGMLNKVHRMFVDAIHFWYLFFFQKKVQFFIWSHQIGNKCFQIKWGFAFVNALNWMQFNIIRNFCNSETLQWIYFITTLSTMSGSILYLKMLIGAMDLLAITNKLRSSSNWWHQTIKAIFFVGFCLLNYY